MHPRLTELFDRHVATTYAKQAALAETIGERDWFFRMHPGTLSFGDEFTWKVQILGSQSDLAGTWLWAWANEASNIPTALLQASLRMQSLGEELGIPELTEPEIEVGEVDGFFLAIVATGILQAGACYRGPYKGGAAFFLITDPDYPLDWAERMKTNIPLHFTQVISAQSVHDHRRAFLGFLEDLGLMGHDEGSTVAVEVNPQYALSATFDDLNRVSAIESTMNAQGSQGPFQPGESNP